MSEQADVVLRPEEWDELIATLEEREQALSAVGAERDEADRRFERCFDAYEAVLRERDAYRDVFGDVPECPHCIAIHQRIARLLRLKHRRPTQEHP